VSRVESGGRPNLIVLGGPNGAGKTTAAPGLLQGALHVADFVNADTIAQGLSAFDPAGSAMEAGRILLTRVKSLAARREDFAFETTLASRSFAVWMRELLAEGYALHLFFLWLPTADLAVARVAERVRLGGHHVPEETVRRRYVRGIANFHSLYRPMATSWRLYDNSGAPGLVPIAKGWAGGKQEVLDGGLWQRFSR